MEQDEQTKLIAAQTQTITNLMKVGTINQQLVMSMINALRIFMMDMAALMAAMGQPAPEPPDFLKPLHLVKDDKEPN